MTHNGLPTKYTSGLVHERMLQRSCRRHATARINLKKAWQSRKQESCFSSDLRAGSPAPLSVGEVVLGGCFPAAQERSQLALQEGEEDVVPAEH